MVIRAKKDRVLKLDVIDQKILYNLSVNYRIPRNKLAKSINISPQRLNHRINQLEKDFIEPYVCLNYPGLGINAYLLLYDSLNEEETKRISESENVYYFLRLIGKKQYLAIILAEDIINFCIKETPNQKPEIFRIDKFLPDNWNGYIVRGTKQPSFKFKDYELKAADYKLLSLLCKSPLISSFDLSKKLKMGRKTIKSKINLIENTGIIQKYGFSINIPKTGFLTYFIHLTCKPNEIESTINQVKTNPYSGFLFQSSNNLFFSYITPNSERLFNFLEGIESKTDSIIDVSQNTGEYLVEPLPIYAQNVLEKRAK